MMEVRLLDDRNTWNSWVAEHATGNILQSFEWGEFKASQGWRTLRFAALDQGRMMACAQVFLRQVPTGTIAYCPRGPLFDPCNPDPLERLLDTIHRTVHAHGAIFFKVEPPLLDSSSCHQVFTTWGFRPATEIQPRSTIVVDLSLELDVISSRLNIKTRYNVGLAGRKGIRIAEAGDDGAQVFYSLLQATSHRAGFSVHSLEYYDKVWKLLRSRDMAQLLLATYGDEVIAGTMLFRLGPKAYYMYGASSGRHRNLKPSDLLQWESLRWAKSVGCTAYDMWGIPDEVGQAAALGQDLEDVEEGRIGGKDHGNGKGKNGSAGSKTDASASALWGVYQFKRGFGGDVVRFAGAYDYVYSASRYLLWVRSVPLLRSFIGKVRQLDKSQA
ncbi:MAG: peptidoglycan bridge formation glycyltransferase FemA/FemB family protein [Chloroflexi bacterium]|nr:peptidoglycan bridge formation glycyltransferase FemA/FemB family protein [Chloroflexota bacterium]